MGVTCPKKEGCLPGTMGIRGVFGLLLTLSLAFLPFSEATARTFTSENDSGVEYDTSGGVVSRVSFRFKNGLETVMGYLTEPNSKEIFLQTDAREMLTIFHDGKRVYFTLMEPSPHNDSTGYVAMDTSREWHTVILTFKEREARLEVDDVSYYSYLKKVPQLNKKITIGKSFTGCLDDFMLNGEDIQGSALFDKLKEGCTFPPYLASYTGPNSFFNFSVPTETKMTFLKLTFGFRIFALPTELAVFDFDSGATIQVLLVNNSSIIQVNGETTPGANGQTEATDLNDGSYHSLLMEVNLGEQFNIIIDKKYVYSFTSAVFKTPTPTGFVAINLGSNTQNGGGIEGCMRNVLLQLGSASNNTTDFYLSDFSQNNAITGQCSFKDLCIHEPCAHDAPCTQTKTKDTYSCVCGNSDEGSDCLTARITTQVCEQSSESSVSTEIDPDATGPIPSFYVKCTKEGDTTWTEIPTEQVGDVNIAENEYPYRKEIDYQNKVTLQQLESLITRSWECKQMISFTCEDSRLMQKMAGTDKPYGYWEGGSEKVPHFYWGGSNSSSLYKCAGGNPCKCDNSTTRPATDAGNLTTNMDLPVAAVVFNETSDRTTDTSAKYMVGPLMCRHDRYLDDSSAVTFNGTTSLAINSVTGDTPVDISFMFKTTVAQGYLVHSEVIKREGDPDLYFSVKISGKEELSITIQSREVFVKSFPVHVNTKLDSGVWQFFYFEMNHNQAFVKVALTGTSAYIWRTDNFLPNPKLYPTDKIFVGGSPNGSMGFNGCIKNLRIRGRYFDVSDRASDGIIKGCVSPCHVSSCLNGGRCKEIGPTFACRCADNGYTGCYCGKDSSSNVTENEKQEYVSKAPPNLGKILQVGFSTETNGNKFVVVSEDGSNTNLEISILDTGRLSAKRIGGENSIERTFDGRVDDGMPHYIRVFQDGTKNTVGLDDKNTTFEKLFNLSSVHTIRIGTTDENLQANQTFKGCVFSIKSGNEKFQLKSENTDMNSCAPDHIPMQLKAHMAGIMKHIHDAQQKSEASSAPFVESFSAYSLNDELLEGTDSSPIALSQPIRLVCKTSGLPKPRIIWKENNIVLKTDCYHLMTNDSLVLLPLEEELPKDWTFSCEAVNVYGAARSLNPIHIVNPGMCGTDKLCNDHSLYESGI